MAKDYDPTKDKTSEQTDDALLCHVTELLRDQKFTTLKSPKKFVADLINKVCEDCNGEAMFELMRRAMNRPIAPEREMD